MHVLIYMYRTVVQLRLTSSMGSSSSAWMLKDRKTQKDKRKVMVTKMEKVKRVGHFVVELSKVRIKKTG